MLLLPRLILIQFLAYIPFSFGTAIICNKNETQAYGVRCEASCTDRKNICSFGFECTCKKGFFRNDDESCVLEIDCIKENILPWILQHPMVAMQNLLWKYMPERVMNVVQFPFLLMKMAKVVIPLLMMMTR